MPLDLKEIKMRHENEEVPEENLVSNYYDIEKILKINESMLHINSECFNLEFQFTKEWMNNLVKDLIDLKISVKCLSSPRKSIAISMNTSKGFSKIKKIL